jgi:predicted O-methyltransferase YrrM
VKFSRSAILCFNRFLKKINLRMDTQTLDEKEFLRLKKLCHDGYFEERVFPLPDGFKSNLHLSLLESLKVYGSELGKFHDPTQNDVNYSFKNDWFSSPDAEVLYTMIRNYSPRKIIEVGSGNSTKIIRQAILDGHTDTNLMSIDPNPRVQIDKLVDNHISKPVESLNKTDLFSSLEERDILFIDSSHSIRAGNDVFFLYFYVIPTLNPGVLIHIHDIFIPYDYPEDWVVDERREYNEQYLVQSLLMNSTAFHVIWPGYHLQHTLPNFLTYFPNNTQGRSAVSLWLQKI